MFPWEKQAMDGQELPDGLDYPEQILYLSLRMLYSQLKQRIIDRPIAVREKKRLMEEYRLYKFNWELGNSWAKTVRETELARAAYLKDRTVENANKLVSAIEGRNLQ